MEIKELLPLGTVVILKGGIKRLMIIGVKQTDTSTGKEYDYLSVIYPEGFITSQTTFFFNHDSIERVFFTGYDDEERTEFLAKLEKFYSSAE